MKKVEEFTLTDEFELDDRTIEEYAMGAAKRQQELRGDFTIQDIKVTLKKARIIREFQIEVLGEDVT